MNARAYFTILRPVRTLVIALIYGMFIWLWLWSLFRATKPESLFFSLAVIGPVLVGSLLLGPIHEVMHRNFFAILPDARLALRQWHLRAVAVVSLLIFIPAALFVTGTPAAALFGLIVAGLSLPILNNRRRWGLFRPHFPLLVLAGIFFAAFARSTVASACLHAPWGVFVVGLGFSYFSFRIGFSAQNVRDRWRDPFFFSFQSMIPFLGGGDVASYARAQGRQLAQEQNQRKGSKWTVRVVGCSLRDWVRVVHYSRNGAVSLVRQLMGMLVGGAMVTPVCIATTFCMTRFAPPELGGSAPSSLKFFCEQIVEAGRLHGSLQHFHSSFILAMPPTLVCFSFVVTSLVFAVPAYRLPTSRERLADCLFIESHRLLASLFTIYVGSTALCFAGACFFARQPLDAGIFKGALATALPMPLFCTLGLSTLLVSRHSVVRILIALIMILGCVAIDIAILAKFSPLILTPFGLFVCVSVTLAAGCLSWRMFRRHYRNCDLNHANTILKTMGLSPV